MNKETPMAQGPVDVNVRPSVADRYAQPVTLADGSIQNFMLRINGKPYRCDCGCNVFHKPDRRYLDLYECNGCEQRFEAT